MGMFTWTDATVKKPRLDKYDDYDRRDIVEYGGYAKLICPDNSEIETESHDYYGVIGGRDIYELVAEWNRESLTTDNLSPKPNDPSRYGGLYSFEKESMRQEGKSEEEIEAADKKKRSKYFKMAVNRWERMASLLEEFKAGTSDKILEERYGEDWLREIGIEISCEDENAKKLKYPIKLTKDRNAHGYNNLYISYSCQ